MFNTAFAQPLQNRALRCLTFIPQRIVHIAALFVLCRQSRRSAQISLIAQDNQKLRLLSIRSVLEDPWSNLAQGSALILGVRLA